MPGVKKKDLHLAQNVGELNKMAGALPDIKNVRLCVSSAEKLFKKAEETSLLGDEEKAYVLYMKFFNFISGIKKTADYKKNEKYYKDMIGMNNLLKAMDEAESLSNSLKNRYEEREAKAVSKKLEKLSDEAEVDQSSNPDEVAPPAESADTTQSVSKNESNISEADPHFMTVTQLYSLLQDVNTTVLMLDVRAVEEYRASHISHTTCVNVPYNIVPPGCTVNKIEKLLPAESKDMWDRRALFDFIVMIDWVGNDNSLMIKSTMHSLKDAIYKWDQTKVVKSEPLVLRGGFSDLLLYYPMIVTNAHVDRPKFANNTTALLPSLDNIDYDLELNFLKPPEQLASEESKKSITIENLAEKYKDNNLTPKVDRSIKPRPLTGINSNQRDTPLNTDREKQANTNIDFRKPHISFKLNDLRKELMNEDKAAGHVKDTNIKKQGTVEIPKPVMPSVDRALKPAAGFEQDQVSPEPSDGSSSTSSRTSSTVSLDSAVPSPKHTETRAPADLTEAEIQQLRTDTQRIVREHRARLAKLKQEQESMGRLQEMKSKEVKETASLLRTKQQIQEEILQLERLLEEKERRMAAADEKWLDEHIRRQQEAEHEDRRKLRGDSPSVERKLAKPSTEEGKENREKAKDEDKAAQNADTLKEQEKQHQKEQREMERQKEEQERASREKAQRDKEERLRLERETQTARDQRDQMAAEAKLAKEKLERMEREAKLVQEKHEKEQKLAEERAKLEKQRKLQDQLTKKDLEEKLRQEQEIKAKADKERQEQERRAVEARNKEASKSKLVTPGLLVGWEKRLDSATGRYYYIDHKTKKTQWEPPQSLTPTQPAQSTTMKVRLKDEHEAPASGSLKRSHSSPNIAKMIGDEKLPKPSQPQVSRTTKPKPRPLTLQTDVSAAKVRNLQPVWGSMARGLTGLKNLGNTCYMNSIIQCLSNTSPLTFYILSDSFTEDINRENIFGKGGELAEEFAVLIKALWSGQYKSISPRDFKMTVAKYHELFAGYSQQDSQELLLFLMDGLHEDLNRVVRRQAIPEQENDGVPDLQAADTAWKLHKSVNESVIVELFQGQFKSTVRCLTCSKKSVTFDAFMYLTLPIPSTTRCSVKECLQHFSKEEKMSGESQWHCPRCKGPRDAVKQIAIWKLPPILLIHLKRFYYQGMWRQKLTTYVDYPLDGFDMNKFVCGPKTKRPFSLYGVSNHYGSLDGGHYTAYCKNSSAQRWCKYDDHEVYNISSSDIQSSAAYILFYTSMELGPLFK